MKNIGFFPENCLGIIRKLVCKRRLQASPAACSLRQTQTVFTLFCARIYSLYKITARKNCRYINHILLLFLVEQACVVWRRMVVRFEILTTLNIQWAVKPPRVRTQSAVSSRPVRLHGVTISEKKSSYICYSVICKGMADSNVWSTATRFHSIRTLPIN